MSFISELKRRNVVRMAVLYAVAAWVVLQIADVLFDQLGVPPWAFRLVLGLLILGFPLALIFSWVFELTPDGVQRTREVDPSQSGVQQTGQRMNVLIVVLLLLAIGGLIADRLIPEPGSTITGPVAETAAPGVVPASHGPTDQAAEAENTIAVLPFVNMSDDPDNDYFSDGLSEELLNTLVRIGGLKVTGRTSSFAFKDDNRDLREIGEILDVANVLEGSVRKAGNRVRITAQLIETDGGYHLWSDTFDRELDDIFAIQREIAEEVTQAMQVTLFDDELSGDASLLPDDRNPKAHEQYLRGMYIWQREPDAWPSLDRARTHFEAALEIDPEYVDAHWGMFLVWNRMNRNAHGPFAESLEKMQHYTSELQRLAPQSDHALGAAARMAVLRYDYHQSAAFLEEATRRFPANTKILGTYANTLAIIKRYDRALELVNRAEELDPLSLDVKRIKSFALYRMGDCEAVEEVMNRAIELEPEVGRFRHYLAMCIFETTGEAAKALPFAEAEPLNWARETALAILYNDLGENEKAREQFDTMFERAGDGASYQFGQIYAQWGEEEKSLEWLENALRVRDPGLSMAGDDRLLVPLHGEPHFQKILKDAGHR